MTTDFVELKSILEEIDSFLKSGLDPEPNWWQPRLKPTNQTNVRKSVKMDKNIHIIDRPPTSTNAMLTSSERVITIPPPSASSSTEVAVSSNQSAQLHSYLRPLNSNAVTIVSTSANFNKPTRAQESIGTTKMKDYTVRNVLVL